MKKHIFRFATLLCTAALGLTACTIDDPVAGPIIGGGNQPGPGPGGKEYIITPDGDFSDWDAIPAAEVVESTVPDDAFFPTGKKVKVYAGATYINLYVEFEEDPSMPVQIMHLYIDSDNDQTTGYGNTAWKNDGSDILFEGYLVDEETGGSITYDPTIFTYEGEPLAENWDGWTEAVAPGLGVCSNSEFVELENGHKAFEMTILRSAIPGLGTTFRMGVALQYDWNDIAYLPAASAVDSNGTLEHGPAENLLIGATGTAAEPSNAQITIDGDFSDWDALDKLDLFEFTAPEGCYYKSMHTLRAAYNKDYLYIYLEYDGSEETDAQILQLLLDSDAAFENGLATTGWGGWFFDNDGSDLLLEGELVGYDPTVMQWTGDPMSGDWDWTTILEPGAGVVSGSQAVTLENGHTAVEISISRAMPGMESDKCLIGAAISNSDWTNIGMLPVGIAVDDQNVLAEKLAIDFTRRNDQGGDGPAPTPTETTITVDGDLSDWDNVTAANGYEAIMPEDARYKGARKLKVTADKNYIYLYVEYDNSEEANVGIMDVWLDTDMAFDASGFATSGCGSWIWSNDGSEYMIQGQLFDESGNGGWAYADINMYSGTPLANEWAWTPVVTGGSGATNSSKAVDLGNGTSAIEASIMRAAIPGLGDRAMLGVMLETASWSESGVLPQLPADESGNYVAAEKLTIVLP